MANDNNNATLDDVIRRLDAIVYLLLSKEQDMNSRRMIAKLAQTSLKNQEIADIMNTSRNYVDKEISLLKKADKKSKK